MSDMMKTGGFVGVTAVLVLVALISGPRFSEPAMFDDQDEVFFPEFTDPSQPVALEIVEYEAETASIKPFKVHFQDGRWSIPSHHDYAADAKERMAEAAGFFIGLTKDDIRSDEATDHALFGVVGPSDQTASLEGRGTLVSFTDQSGNTLASLILGKEVEGREGMRYVRIPDKKRTYVSKLPGELSTDFEDWIETDLLQMASSDLEKMVFDTYSIDEQTRTVTPGARVEANKDGYDWAIADLGELEEVKKEPLSTAASTLDQLKIVGVRPKPAGLSASLTRDSAIELTRQSQFSLLQRGYFLANDGSLYSNEGDLTASTEKGIVYTLRFGEILYGSGDSVTAGSDDESQTGSSDGEETPDGEEGSKEDDDDNKGLAANRYLMVTVRMDASFLDKPDGEPLPADHLTKRATARTEIESLVRAVESYKDKNESFPDALAALTEGDEPLVEELKKDPWDRDYVYEIKQDALVISSLGDDGERGGEGIGHDIASDDLDFETAQNELATDMEAYDKKVTDGIEEVAELSARFAPWYYVIDDENFKKLHLTKTDVVETKDPPEEAIDETKDPLEEVIDETKGSLEEVIDETKGSPDEVTEEIKDPPDEEIDQSKDSGRR